MKLYLTSIMMLFSSLLSGQEQSVKKSALLQNLYVSGAIGVNFNYHYSILDLQERYRHNWMNLGVGAGFKNNYFALGMRYEQPRSMIHPPKKQWHNWFAEVQLNLLAIANNEFSKKHFFGPWAFFGQTTGYQDVNLEGKIRFDDRIQGFGVIYSLQVRSAIHPFISGYRYSFIEDNVVVVGQNNDEQHRNLNFSIGVILNPTKLIAEKRKKSKN